MFWDRVASVYDLAENMINKKVYNNTGAAVAEYIDRNDDVLECACGTGAISEHIAPECRSLIAVDISKGMLKQTAEKLRFYDNVKVRKADITSLKCRDERFDKVVAGNVIHLLDDPGAAVNELLRVCRTGGKVIIPTYINSERRSSRLAAKLLGMVGVGFIRQFDLESYKEFFRSAGFEDVEYRVVEGRMPCALAVITKKGK